MSAVSLGRVVAHQQCVGMPTLLPPVTGRWRGLGPEALDYLKSASGAKNMVFKASSYAVNALHYATEMPPEAVAFGKACRDSKNALAIAELPKHCTTVVSSVHNLVTDPSVKTVHKAVIGVVGAVNPTVDVIDFFHSRGVIHLAPETMKACNQANAGALLVVMTDRSVTNGAKILEAASVLCEDPMANQTNYDERADLAKRMLLLSLIDLAMAVSYVAVASIALISAFILTIEHAGFWILAGLISSLFFTILGEFAQRAYNPNPGGEIIIPPVLIAPPDTAAI